MDTTIKKTSDIEVKVGLNKDNLPVKIEWRATDNPDLKEFQECKAMMLGFFAKESLETMKMDLWTTEMQVNEMDRFMFQSLRAMADTYFRATKNSELASDMQKFVQYFGEQTKILVRDEGEGPK